MARTKQTARRAVTPATPKKTLPARLRAEQLVPVHEEGDPEAARTQTVVDIITHLPDPQQMSVFVNYLSQIQYPQFDAIMSTASAQDMRTEIGKALLTLDLDQLRALLNRLNLSSARKIQSQRILERLNVLEQLQAEPPSENTVQQYLETVGYDGKLEFLLAFLGDQDKVTFEYQLWSKPGAPPLDITVRDAMVDVKRELDELQIRELEQSLRLNKKPKDPAVFDAREKILASLGSIERQQFIEFLKLAVKPRTQVTGHMQDTLDLWIEDLLKRASLQELLQIVYTQINSQIADIQKTLVTIEETGQRPLPATLKRPLPPQPEVLTLEERVAEARRPQAPQMIRGIFEESEAPIEWLASSPNTVPFIFMSNQGLVRVGDMPYNRVTKNFQFGGWHDKPYFAFSIQDAFRPQNGEQTFYASPEVGRGFLLQLTDQEAFSEWLSQAEVSDLWSLLASLIYFWETAGFDSEFHFPEKVSQVVGTLKARTNDNTVIDGLNLLRRPVFGLRHIDPKEGAVSKKEQTLDANVAFYAEEEGLQWLQKNRARKDIFAESYANLLRSVYPVAQIVHAKDAFLAQMVATNKAVIKKEDVEALRQSADEFLQATIPFEQYAPQQQALLARDILAFRDSIARKGYSIDAFNRISASFVNLLEELKAQKIPRKALAQASLGLQTELSKWTGLSLEKQEKIDDAIALYDAASAPVYPILDTSARVLAEHLPVPYAELEQLWKLNTDAWINSLFQPPTECDFFHLRVNALNLMIQTNQVAAIQSQPLYAEALKSSLVPVVQTEETTGRRRETPRLPTVQRLDTLVVTNIAGVMCENTRNGKRPNLQDFFRSILEHVSVRTGIAKNLSQISKGSPAVVFLGNYLWLLIKDMCLLEETGEIDLLSQRYIALQALLHATALLK